MNWNHLGRIALLVTLLTALLSAGSLAASRTVVQEATPAPDSLLAQLGYPELSLTTDGEVATVPATVEAGRYHVLLQNDSPFPTDLILFAIPDDMTLEDLEPIVEEANMTGVMAPLLYEIVINGGAYADPGAVGEAVLDLTPGEWGISLTSFDEATGEVTTIYEPLSVTGEMPQLDDPEGAVVVHLVDFDFVVPDDLVAGPQVWKVHSSGQPHHLVLMQVPEGATDEQVYDAINAAYFAGPATPVDGATPDVAALSIEEFVEIGYSSILSSGQANWLEWDLAPGTYAALCFVASPEGVPHVMMGMIEVFTVAEE
jgi:hypothetical protein